MTNLLTPDSVTHTITHRRLPPVLQRLLSNFLSNISIFISCDDVFLAPVFIFSNCFSSSNTTTDYYHWSLFHGVKFFFLLFGDILLKETCPQTGRSSSCYMAILGELIMLMIKSVESSPPHEQVMFIRLKKQFMRSSSYSDLKHSYEQTDQSQRGLEPESENVLAWGPVF